MIKYTLYINMVYRDVELNTLVRVRILLNRKINRDKIKQLRFLCPHHEINVAVFISEVFH